ncbi:YjaG family protein [soil metagenome]
MPVFNSELIRILERAEAWRRIGFMARCCNRAIPNYRIFSVETGFGDVTVLERSLNFVESWIHTGILPMEAQDLLGACDTAAPHTEEHGSLYTSAALYAANMMAITLETLTAGLEPDVIEVAQLAFDTVEMFTSTYLAADSYDVRIYLHPIMLAEDECQRNDTIELCHSEYERSNFILGPAEGSVIFKA